MWSRLYKRFISGSYSIAFDDTYKMIKAATDEGFWVAWQEILFQNNLQRDLVFEMMERAFFNGHIEVRYICSRKPVQKLFPGDMNNLEFAIPRT